MLRKLTFGEKVKPPQIEKFKGTKDSNAIISLVSKEGIQCATLHFEPGIGSFHCFEGQCCVDCGPARIQYLLPIVVYHVKDWPSFSVDLEQKVDLRVLKLGEEAYNKLITKNAMIDLEKCDLLVITEDEKFQRLNFEIILDRETASARPPAWRMNNLMRAAVIREYQNRYVALIESSMGKALNPETYQAAKVRAAQNKAVSPVTIQTPSIPAEPNFAALNGVSPGMLPNLSPGVLPTEAPPAESYTPHGIDEVSEEDLARLIS